MFNYYFAVLQIAVFVWMCLDNR